jgi:hypothetical protein
MKKTIFISLFSAVFAFFSVFNVIQAQTALDTTLEGLNSTASRVDAFRSQTNESFGPGFLTTKVGQVVGVVLAFVGVLFFVLMIYAGVTWMTARGNEQEISKAKTMITNAVIGIVIVFAAYALTYFIGRQILE